LQPAPCTLHLAPRTFFTSKRRIFTSGFLSGIGLDKQIIIYLETSRFLWQGYCNKLIRNLTALMKKSAFVIVALFAFALTAGAQIYKGKKTTVSFYSYTPMENITATDTVATVLLNSKTGDVIANVSIKAFVFPNPLMQEHFNENYMESEKFPMGSFKGKINETVDYTKDGTYTVSMTGTLTLHGVAQPRTITGIALVVKGNTVTVDFKFNVLLKDHNIKVPEVMSQKIAESIQVSVHSELTTSAGTKK
jgi:hypothetical protein